MQANSPYSWAYPGKEAAVKWIRPCVICNDLGTAPGGGPCPVCAPKTPAATRGTA